MLATFGRSLLRLCALHCRSQRLLRPPAHAPVAVQSPSAQLQPPTQLLRDRLPLDRGCRLATGGPRAGRLPRALHESVCTPGLRVAQHHSPCRRRAMGLRSHWLRQGDRTLVSVLVSGVLRCLNVRRCSIVFECACGGWSYDCFGCLQLFICSSRPPMLHQACDLANC